MIRRAPVHVVTHIQAYFFEVFGPVFDDIRVAIKEISIVGLNTAIFPLLSRNICPSFDVQLKAGHSPHFAKLSALIDPEITKLQDPKDRGIVKKLLAVIEEKTYEFEGYLRNTPPSQDPALCAAVCRSFSELFIQSYVFHRISFSTFFEAGLAFHFMPSFLSELLKLNQDIESFAFSTFDGCLAPKPWTFEIGMESLRPVVFIFLHNVKHYVAFKDSIVALFSFIDENRAIFLTCVDYLPFKIQFESFKDYVEQLLKVCRKVADVFAVNYFRCSLPQCASLACAATAQTNSCCTDCPPYISHYVFVMFYDIAFKFNGVVSDHLTNLAELFVNLDKSIYEKFTRLVRIRTAENVEFLFWVKARSLCISSFMAEIQAQQKFLTSCSELVGCMDVKIIKQTISDALLRMTTYTKALAILVQYMDENLTVPCRSCTTPLSFDSTRLFIEQLLKRIVVSVYADNMYSKTGSLAAERLHSCIQKDLLSNVQSLFKLGSPEEFVSRYKEDSPSDLCVFSGMFAKYREFFLAISQSIQCLGFAKELNSFNLLDFQGATDIIEAASIQCVSLMTIFKACCAYTDILKAFFPYFLPSVCDRLRGLLRLSGYHDIEATLERFLCVSLVLNKLHPFLFSLVPVLTDSLVVQDVCTQWKNLFDIAVAQFQGLEDKRLSFSVGDCNPAAFYRYFSIVLSALRADFLSHFVYQIMSLQRQYNLCCFKEAKLSVVLMNHQAYRTYLLGSVQRSMTLSSGCVPFVLLKHLFSTDSVLATLDLYLSRPDDFLERSLPPFLDTELGNIELCTIFEDVHPAAKSQAVLSSLLLQDRYVESTIVPLQSTRESSVSRIFSLFIYHQLKSFCFDQQGDYFSHRDNDDVLLTRVFLDGFGVMQKWIFDLYEQRFPEASIYEKIEDYIAIVDDRELNGPRWKPIFCAIIKIASAVCSRFIDKNVRDQVDKCSVIALFDSALAPLSLFSHGLFLLKTLSPLQVDLERICLKICPSLYVTYLHMSDTLKNIYDVDFDVSQVNYLVSETARQPSNVDDTLFLLIINYVAIHSAMTNLLYLIGSNSLLLGYLGTSSCTFSEFKEEDRLWMLYSTIGHLTFNPRTEVVYCLNFYANKLLKCALLYNITNYYGMIDDFIMTNVTGFDDMPFLGELCTLQNTCQKEPSIANLSYLCCLILSKKDDHEGVSRSDKFGDLSSFSAQLKSFLALPLMQFDPDISSCKARFFISDVNDGDYVSKRASILFQNLVKTADVSLLLKYLTAVDLFLKNSKNVISSSKASPHANHILFSAVRADLSKLKSSFDASDVRSLAVDFGVDYLWSHSIVDIGGIIQDLSGFSCWPNLKWFISEILSIEASFDQLLQLLPIKAAIHLRKCISCDFKPFQNFSNGAYVGSVASFFRNVKSFDLLHKYLQLFCSLIQSLESVVADSAIALALKVFKARLAIPIGRDNRMRALLRYIDTFKAFRALPKSNVQVESCLRAMNTRLAKIFLEEVLLEASLNLVRQGVIEVDAHGKVGVSLLAEWRILLANSGGSAPLVAKLDRIIKDCRFLELKIVKRKKQSVFKCAGTAPPITEPSPSDVALLNEAKLKIQLMDVMLGSFILFDKVNYPDYSQILTLGRAQIILDQKTHELHNLMF